MRKEFKMNEKQFKEMLEACKPVPYMVIGEAAPLSSQERANEAWKKLGNELKFDSTTVKAVSGKDAGCFSAESVE